MGSSTSATGRKTSGCAMKLSSTSTHIFLLPSEVSVLCYALQHRPRLQNERRQRDATEVRAGPQLGDDVHEDCIAVYQYSLWRMGRREEIPFPCSASTTVSSSVRCMSRSASCEARLPVCIVAQYNALTSSACSRKGGYILAAECRLCPSTIFATRLDVSQTRGGSGTFSLANIKFAVVDFAGYEAVCSVQCAHESPQKRIERLRFERSQEVTER